MKIKMEMKMKMKTRITYRLEGFHFNLAKH